MSSAARDGLECVPTRPIVLAYDVSGIDAVDEAVLDRLARLLLAARRLGVGLELRNASRELADLLELVGLGDVLSGEPGREAEEREQLRVDEEVDPSDGTV